MKVRYICYKTLYILTYPPHLIYVVALPRETVTRAYSHATASISRTYQAFTRHLHLLSTPNCTSVYEQCESPTIKESHSLCRSRDRFIPSES